MKVSIVGAGTVGQATGIGLHKYAHEVIFYDIDQQKLETLAKQGYRVTKNLGDIRCYDIHMICVPTPIVNNKPDLTPLESAVKGVAKTLDRQDGYQVVVIRSTILPFTIKKRIIPLLQRYCPLRLGEQYGICHNPEFLREAHALDDFLNPPITVIGETDERSGDMLARLYAPFQSPQVRTTPENAEAIKCFSNAYNATKISFFNKLYLIAERCGLDHEVISQALPKSTTAIRLVEYGIKGGYPFGGECLPKDLAALITFLNEQGLSSHLFQVVAEINEEIRGPQVNPWTSGK
ncbi:MAG: nucleotide sugar dehydrogenase [Dehalococcoidia bacterium]|nr:nucleotide sugar dehydrogenase [Dehalococcoidia bacterium]